MNFFSPNQLFVAIAAALILILHLVYLLRTGKAHLTPLGQGPVACCGDSRENAIREMTVFGGASAFDWGLMYWLIAVRSSGLIQDIAVGYALMRSLSTLQQSVAFIAQARQIKGHATITLKAHLEGCAYTTAASPFWWLYWLGKIPSLKPSIIPIRDWITRIDYLFSKPGTFLLSLISLLLTQHKVRTRLGPTALSEIKPA